MAWWENIKFLLECGLAGVQNRHIYAEVHFRFKNGQIFSLFELGCLSGVASEVCTQAYTMSKHNLNT